MARESTVWNPPGSCTKAISDLLALCWTHLLDEKWCSQEEVLREGLAVALSSWAEHAHSQVWALLHFLKGPGLQGIHLTHVLSGSLPAWASGSLQAKVWESWQDNFTGIQSRETQCTCCGNWVQHCLCKPHSEQFLPYCLGHKTSSKTGIKLCKYHMERHDIHCCQTA